MIHLPFNLPSRSTKSIQPRVFVFHLEYTTASYFTHKNVELNITWALGHDQRLFTEQTVASIIGSITAPLLFWGGVECVLEGLRWKVELKGMTVCDGHRDNEALMDLIGCSLHCSTLQSKCQASENTANTTVFLAYIFSDPQHLIFACFPPLITYSSLHGWGKSLSAHTAMIIPIS